MIMHRYGKWAYALSGVIFLLTACGSGPAAEPTITPALTNTTVPTSTTVPTETPLPTSTPVVPTATPMAFSIQDKNFEAVYKGSCVTDVTIGSVEGTVFGVSGSLSMRNNEWVLWCYGARHTWTGTLTYAGYTFISDVDNPLLFIVDETKGYVYIEGIGSITSPDGSTAVFGKGEVSTSTAPSIKVTGCAFSSDCPDAVLIYDLFEDSNLLEYNKEYDLPIPQDAMVRFGYGWCSIDKATLDDNLSQMRFVFTIDGVSYIENFNQEYYNTQDSEDPTIENSCYQIGGVASGWQESLTYRVAFGVIFEDALFDGWDTYPKSNDSITYLMTALSGWKGIPIMPGAMSEQEEMGDYQFTINVSAAEIKAYYQSEMANLGWKLRQDMMDSIPTDLAFVKSGTFAFFKILPDGADNMVMIHIVKQ